MHTDTIQMQNLPKQPATQLDAVQLGALDHSLAFHLRMAQYASFKAFKHLSGDCSLKPGWLSVLSLIDGNPGITPMTLSRVSGRDKSTLTPVLRELAKKKLIDRKALNGDKRSYTLSLTADGKDELAALSTHACKHEQELDDIVGNHKDVLLDLLRRITAQFD